MPRTFPSLFRFLFYFSNLPFYKMDFSLLFKRDFTILSCFKINQGGSLKDVFSPVTTLQRISVEFRKFA